MSDHEKGVDLKAHNAAPGHNPVAADVIRDEDFMTRNGLNAKSFQRRDYGTGIVELDRSMKGRHLQMIAIGS